MPQTSPIWEDRRKLHRLQRRLEGQLKDLEREESLLMEELARVDEQVAYYGSLAKDMKKALDPPTLSRLLRSLRKA